ncbi:44812_t:CDS:2 [Gigaspora margarita]|uniref:44812_t:CDS:1 n=1 Tax=Gigaspora margarita TaxID=4874 RepID=A0ABN7VS23_GIGMA|nr:44812_t:CDS:2 [Gigaspora margarita]
MLIWELVFEKFPYEDISSTNQVMEHVINGNRENIIFGQITPENQRLQQGLMEIITAGNPQNRIRLAEIFLKLEKLSLNCTQPCYRTSLYPDGYLDLDGSKLNKQLSITESNKPFITEIKSLEEGIAAHKNKDYEKAWKIFELHSDLGNSTAKYWKARYLVDGVFVNKDITQAASLFKEAAEDNNTDACFRYALMMTDKSSGVKYNCEKFIEYLMKAADAGNAMAQYNLGDIYLKGNLPSLSNSDLGIKYLKLAALNGHSKAVEILKEKDININE